MINVPNLKYKTTLCLNWQEGTPCEKGPNCYFAHGEHQLRKIEENQQAIASRNLYYQNFQQSSNYKTVYCQCKLGASCTFAHQRKQKRKVYKPGFVQQPPVIPYMPFHVPYIYPVYQTFDPSHYYAWSYESFGNVENDVEQMSPTFKKQELGEIQPQSQEKKRSRIEERSTIEKEQDEVQKEEDMLKNSAQNKCFNFE